MLLSSSAAAGRGVLVRAAEPALLPAAAGVAAEAAVRVRGRVVAGAVGAHLLAAHLRRAVTL